MRSDVCECVTARSPQDNPVGNRHPEIFCSSFSVWTCVLRKYSQATCIENARGPLTSSSRRWKPIIALLDFNSSYSHFFLQDTSQTSLSGFDPKLWYLWLLVSERQISPALSYWPEVLTEMLLHQTDRRQWEVRPHTPVLRSRYNQPRSPPSGSSTHFSPNTATVMSSATSSRKWCSSKEWGKRTKNNQYTGSLQLDLSNLYLDSWQCNTYLLHLLFC